MRAKRSKKTKRTATVLMLILLSSTLLILPLIVYGADVEVSGPKPGKLLWPDYWGTASEVVPLLTLRMYLEAVQRNDQATADKVDVLSAVLGLEKELQKVNLSKAEPQILEALEYSKELSEDQKNEIRALLLKSNGLNGLWTYTLKKVVEQEFVKKEGKGVEYAARIPRIPQEKRKILNCTIAFAAMVGGIYQGNWGMVLTAYALVDTWDCFGLLPQTQLSPKM